MILDFFQPFFRDTSTVVGNRNPAMEMEMEETVDTPKKNNTYVFKFIWFEDRLPENTLSVKKEVGRKWLDFWPQAKIFAD